VDALPGQATEALGGSIDILIANAGITKDGLLMRMKQEDFDNVIKINLESYFRLATRSDQLRSVQSGYDWIFKVTGSRGRLARHHC